VTRPAPLVTLDGPAGSGKSTTAAEVARRLGFRHLDSGALYRALTHALISERIPKEEWPLLDADALDRYDIRLDPTSGSHFRVLLRGAPVDDAMLRRREVNAQVSTVASLPQVRRWLLVRQRQAGEAGRLVADGRDMGTVVFPDAEVKIFLVADIEERARRRLKDHGILEPGPSEIREEAERIGARDARDIERESSPLVAAPDAWLLDTTGLDFEAQVAEIVARVVALTGSG
jgi:cytidylate kinase